jgi:DNA-directed RNA polymerase subunit beta
VVIAFAIDPDEFGGMVSERLWSEGFFRSRTAHTLSTVCMDTRLGTQELDPSLPGMNPAVGHLVDESGVVTMGARVRGGDVVVAKATPTGGEPPNDRVAEPLVAPPGVSGRVTRILHLRRAGIELQPRDEADAEREIEAYDQLIAQARETLQSVKDELGESVFDRTHTDLTKAQRSFEHTQRWPRSELPPGWKHMIGVTIEDELDLQNNNLWDRHGNRYAGLNRTPEDQMPRLSDGTPVDIVYREPSGEYVLDELLSRAVLEARLGLAARRLGRTLTIDDGEPDLDAIGDLCREAGLDDEGLEELFDADGRPLDVRAPLGILYLFTLLPSA